MLSNGFVVVDEMRNRKSYDGATEKFGITVDNEDYIVKFSSVIRANVRVVQRVRRFEVYPEFGHSLP